MLSLLVFEPAQPDAPAGPAPPPPGDPPVGPGDPPTFAPDVNDPQSSETAIRTYRAGLTDHVRQQLLFEASRAEHDAATAAYNTYQAALAEYVSRERAYITDLAAWRVADRRALTILLATIPPTLKRELAPTSSSHLWRLLTDLYDRQDVATLYSLIKEFQSLTMDSTTGAAAFTRRVLDLARRLAALGVPYPDPVLCCHLLEGLTSAFDTHKIAYMQLIDKRITPAERCGQTTHATDSCFKALSDEWFARGNTGTPPRWSSLSPRPTPQESQLPLAPPPIAPPQQPYPAWTAGTAASAAHLSGASPAPSATSSVTPFPSSGFVGMVSQAGTPAPSMYSAAINENVIQYSVPPPPPHPPPSTTLDFVLDSGATESVLRDAGTLHPLPAPTSLLGADSSFSIPCRHTSTLPCPLFPSGTVTGLHIPSLRTNLLSQRSLQQAGITTVFPGRANQCLLYHPTGRLLSRIPFCPRSRLYTLRVPRLPSAQAVSRSLLPPHISPPPLPPSNPTIPPLPPDPTCSCRSLSHPTVLLHHRLGHPNFATLRSTVSSGLLRGLPLTLPPLPPSLAPPCSVCVQSKLKQLPHRSSPSAAAQPLDLVHMDLWGPNPSPSRQGHRYMLVLVDDHSRYSSVPLLRSKGDASAAIIAWLKQASTHFGRPVRRLHSDGGGEFLNRQVASYCELHGIRQTHTLPHSPQQNGVAESRVREITKIARCLLVHASCPPSLWGYALLHATLLTNLYPHPILPSTTPTELWTSAKPDVSSLRVWGSRAYVLIHPADRPRTMGKLASRTLPCIFLGHNPSSPDYLFLHPPSGRFLRSRDVVFDESTPYYSTPPPTDPLAPSPRPLNWSDTIPPPLLPPPPILPPAPPPPFPAASAPSAPPSSGDIFDPDPFFPPRLPVPLLPLRSLPSSPLPSSPLSPATPSPLRRTRSILTRYPHTRSRDAVLGAPPPVILSSSTLPPLSPLMDLLFQTVLQQNTSPTLPSSSSTAVPTAAATAAAAVPPTAAAPAAAAVTSSSPSPAAAAAAAADAAVAAASAAAAADASSAAAAAAVLPFIFHSSLLEDSHEEFLNLHMHDPAVLPISPDLSGTPVFAFSSAPIIFVPATYKEAMACPDAHLWLAAILKELEAFIANSSFVDVPRPPSTTNVVKGKWVFRVKQLPGEPPVYKARYVAKGFTQRYAVDFFDTFSPTAKPATIRAVLDLAARLNMEIHSMDVSNAFLQGVLRELIYMERPAGFHLPFPSDSVWQLRRPVYGLKQAPREWHAKLAATLAELGFSTSRADPSLFLRTSPSPFYILVYVDDMILITADSAELERVKRELGSRLKCKDLGGLQHYLAWRLPATVLLAPSPSPRATTCSRSWSGSTWLEAPLRSPLFLLGTISLPSPPPPPPPTPTLSSSALSCMPWPDRRSSQGYGFSLGSGLISWRSTRSSSIALSSCEAELYAATMAAQEARWLSFLLEELGAPQRCPTIWCDNASTIHLTKDAVFHGRSKHIELRHYFIRELVQGGHLQLGKIDSAANLADIFTKALPHAAHSSLLRLLGLAPPVPSSASCFKPSSLMHVGGLVCCMWGVLYVGCVACGVCCMWGVLHVGCAACFGVLHVGCVACGVCCMWGVLHVGCVSCGMY
ncbi:hypothetical protein CLOP_g22518 [Closterium sp. NIES-67]|nr:hypothetical protein CLOP_g22518 [Closterium sp. NIES-67]